MMNILIASHLYPPSVGGIESVTRILAEQFAKAGHAVSVVTETAEPDGEASLVKVHRNPDGRTRLRLMQWCDVFFQSNVSLRSLWPLAIRRKAWAVAHHTWIRRPDGRTNWQDVLKLRLLRYATNICVSKAIAERLDLPSIVITNPYDADVFRFHQGNSRSTELIFVGRLVSDKGVDLLLRSLRVLRGLGITPRLTIVGTGPEESSLRSFCHENGLDTQITFAGSVTGSALAELLNTHLIMVVPSRWAEPFGIVALEGLACGCSLIGSEEGGLKEAIGTCGITFPNGNIEELAASIERLLIDSQLRAQLSANVHQHLSNHHPMVVASKYLAIFEALPK